MELPVRPSVFHSRDVISVILGGGAGTRLFPLTKDRSKPAVPLAGKYRIVDIPISNCLNSGLKRIFLLTQFNSSSLHRHIQQSYQFDDFSNGFVEIMAAQQTPGSDAWYQGTADAVRQNLQHFGNSAHKYVLILSGDQLYRMNFRAVLEQHIKSGADVTVATIPVSRSDARSFGIMQIDGEERITRFVEKPQEDPLLDTLRMDGSIRDKLGIYGGDDLLLASMGIYVFNRDVLDKALAGKHVDFGKHIIPNLISSGRLFAYVYQGYWEDIGTIKAFYDANLDLVNEVPKFNFFDTQAPIYTHARYLPASKIVRGHIERAAIADGCIIVDAKIEHSIIGIRSRIETGASVKDSILMGLDDYETAEEIQAGIARGLPMLGVGKNTHIERAIVDKNARIGDNVRISPEGKPENHDGDNYYIRDGIVVVPKGGIIPSGTVI
ncbi:MAG TPA: glucose-1-phosphate adenylyltransferase [Candidatus Methylacidiphilales bacterium]|jgi:glucose-1-phosphate adenylyltransferase|nr:glucose-1-phosphate adenylyltransferase [Candidatus Methylacidiphilales bacterium]